MHFSKTAFSIRKKSVLGFQDFLKKDTYVYILYSRQCHRENGDKEKEGKCG